MPYMATNLVAGEFGVPGFGVFRGHETREVPHETAAWLLRRPEFRVWCGEGDLKLRDAAGKVRFLEYFGPIDSRFGYGGGGITILRALTRLGIEALVPDHYNSDGEVAHPAELPPEAAAHIQRRPWAPEVALCHCLPNDMDRALAPRKIAWTMWESSRIPYGQLHDGPYDFGDWAEHINRHAERLIVPCQHNAEVFPACGVNVPVTVIPYGLDTDIWPYTERPERDTFTVVQFGDLTIRKGPFEAVAAFQRAFPTEKDVHLILKTQFGRLGRGGWPIIKDERITLVNETWSRAELVSWLHAADCFIWLSRGEGFGLPPVQAMLTGLPVVLTTNTGMAEYYDPRYFSGVNNAGMSESPLGGEWYEPDVDHAADQLRQVYEHRKTALGKAKRGATWLRNTFSIDAFAGRLDAFLQTL